MTCPRCQIEFNSAHWGECPHCGPLTAKGDSETQPLEGVFKTTTVMISGEEGGVFPSVDQVPEPLRETLLACTNGPNAATIVIADSKGRTRLAAHLRTMTTAQTGDDNPRGHNASIRQTDTRFRPTWPALLAVAGLAAGLSGAIAWFAVSHLK